MNSVAAEGTKLGGWKKGGLREGQGTEEAAEADEASWAAVGAARATEAAVGEEAEATEDVTEETLELDATEVDGQSGGW